MNGRTSTVPSNREALRAHLAAALTTEHYRRARAGVVASPEDHSTAMADVVMAVLDDYLAPSAEAADGEQPATPAAEATTAAAAAAAPVETMSSSVQLWTQVPGLNAIGGDIGYITLPLRGGVCDLDELHHALGELLAEAGGYLLAGGGMPDLAEGRGVGITRT